MKPVEFHPEAVAELSTAIGYYEECLPALGVDFRKNIETVVGKIQSSPLRWRSYSKRTRRALIPRFPYLVIFLERADQILIIAIAHGKRRPGYWHGRI